MRTFKPGDVVFLNFSQTISALVRDYDGNSFLLTNGDRGVVTNYAVPSYHDTTCYVLFDKHPESPVWLFHKSLRALELEYLRGPSIELEIT